MQRAPIKNHTTSVCYLEQFSGARGKVEVLSLHSGTCVPRDPQAVGYRTYFWGRDKGLRTLAEQRCSEIESAAAPVLRDLPGRWPPKRGTDDWWGLVRFLALHLVRTPQFAVLFDRLREQALGDHSLRSRDLNPDQRDEVAAFMRSERMKVEMLLDHVQRLANLLGSLHWALLRFPGPLLATSDQPLVPVPLLGNHAQVPIEPLSGNLLAQIEFRFVIDPRHALLLSWVDAPDLAEPIDCGLREAVDVNVAVRHRADAEVYWAPGTKPPFILPIERHPTSRALSLHLYADYSAGTVIRSERMRHTKRIFEKLEEQTRATEITTVNITARSEAA